jgi:hypothetical protein
LGQDAEYLKVGAPFLTAPADEPPLIRIESSLMVAFEGWPKLKLPAATMEHKERIFELRTYESPSDQDHRHKVEMFNSGEYDVFEKAGPLEQNPRGLGPNDDQCQAPIAPYTRHVNG